MRDKQPDRSIKNKETAVFDTDYSKWLPALKLRYKKAQIKASVGVNSELIKFYWSLGKDISFMKIDSKYCDKYLEKISKDIRKELLDVKGFSVTNLGYIKRFYEFFQNPHKLWWTTKWREYINAR